MTEKSRLQQLTEKFQADRDRRAEGAMPTDAPDPAKKVMTKHYIIIGMGHYRYEIGISPDMFGVDGYAEALGEAVTKVIKEKS
jgi:hypothetical protein